MILPKKRSFFDYNTIDLNAFKKYKVVFTEKDSLLYYNEPRKYSYIKDKDFFRITSYYTIELKNSDIYSHILKYPYDRMPINNSPKYDYSAKEFLTGNGNYKDFNLNLMVFILKSISPEGYSQRNGIVYNEFNENVISKLQPTDSLMVQEFIMNFKSK